MTLKKLIALEEEFNMMNNENLNEDVNGEIDYSIDNCAYNCLEQIRTIIFEMKRLNIKKI